MSAGSDVAVLVPGSTRGAARRAAAASSERPVLRFVSFAALALYGTLRWATLISPAPMWRLFGLLGLALSLVAAGQLSHGRSRIVVVALAIVSVLAAFALAGVPLSWVRHLRIAVTADGIGQGLSALPRVLLPYLGINQWIQTVILLGAAVLLLDAALIVALSPRRLGDGRRAAAACALIAMAVVPSTLIHPTLPYVQGLVLFLLVAAFMWSDRVRHGDLFAAGGLALLAGAAAMVLAPALKPHRPWLNYQKLATSLAAVHPESFDWTQRYGPLRWPRSGKVVLEVQAPAPHYWKAENLDVFDGRGWVAQSIEAESAQYSINYANIQRWTETLRVTIRSMNTTNVIGAGDAETSPTQIPASGGISDGTWVDDQGLGPGDSYEITTYDPDPTPAQLAGAGTAYPNTLLPAYLTLSIPVDPKRPTSVPSTIPGTAFAAAPSATAGSAVLRKRAAPLVTQQVIFAPFGSQITTAYGPSTPGPATALGNSPYQRAYALARTLEAHAATPYAYVLRVKRYLDSGAYAYNEKTPSTRYPLETFLFGDRLGYCQQFAGAMAMLLRMGGVPARVATGFATGVYDSATHSWMVSDTDAHAWVEVWFPGYGWVRFDPTPAQAPALGGHLPRAVVKGASPSKQTKPSGHGVGTSSGLAPSAAHRGGGGVPVLAIIAIGAALALLGTALVRMLQVGEPTNDDLLAELERAFASCGRRVPTGTTLARLEQRLRGSPEAEAYIRTIRLTRFASASDAPTPAQRRALRGQLRLGLGIGGRVRALWALPPRLRIRVPVSDRGARGIHSS